MERGAWLGSISPEGKWANMYQHSEASGAMAVNEGLHDCKCDLVPTSHQGCFPEKKYSDVIQ